MKRELSDTAKLIIQGQNKGLHRQPVSTRHARRSNGVRADDWAKGKHVPRGQQWHQ